MRTDIKIDLQHGELEQVGIPPPYHGSFNWIKEDDYNMYGELNIVTSGNSINFSKGVGAYVPLKCKYKKMLVKVTWDNTEQINTKNNSEWFEVVDSNEKSIIVSELPLLDKKLYLRFYLADNKITVASGLEMEPEVAASCFQDASLLLQCNPSQSFYNPLCGVGIDKYLHGDLAGSGISTKIKSELTADGIKPNEVLYNKSTGKIELNVEEL